jgi:hypothetical protein
MSDKRADGLAVLIQRMRQMLGNRLFRRRSKPHPAFTAESRSETTRSDIVITGMGIGLGLICALFPWYIFFNQDQFGIRALNFEGSGHAKGPVNLSAQSDRVGAPSESVGILPSQFDLLATGTLPERPDDEGAPTPGLVEQPYPAANEEFRIVHIANGRAMIEDGTGLFVVQPGSRLPDNSRIASITRRNGHWVLVTTADRIVELTP